MEGKPIPTIGKENSGNGQEKARNIWKILTAVLPEEILEKRTMVRGRKDRANPLGEPRSDRNQTRLGRDPPPAGRSSRPSAKQPEQPPGHRPGLQQINGSAKATTDRNGRAQPSPCSSAGGGQDANGGPLSQGRDVSAPALLVCAQHYRSLRRTPSKQPKRRRAAALRRKQKRDAAKASPV